MSAWDVLWVLGAYLWGGIPTAYLAARLSAGIDIRRYGSGNVGASNAVAQLGAAAGVGVGAFDFIGKGILPVVLAQWADAGTAAQVGAALAAVAGHNWSPYIRFTGGRGVSVAGGVVIGFALWYEAAVSAVLIVALGRLAFKDTALFTLVAMAALPVVAGVVGALGLADRPVEVVLMCGGMCALLAAKRITANWEPLLGGQSVVGTVICRVLWDRDVRGRQDWTERTPAGDGAERGDSTERANSAERADGDGG